jgi:hypothetical protein
MRLQKYLIIWLLQLFFLIFNDFLKKNNRKSETTGQKDDFRYFARCIKATPSTDYTLKHLSWTYTGFPLDLITQSFANSKQVKSS